MAPKTVLITGCSKHGLGDALAQAFHKSGCRVIASGRDLKKLAHFSQLGIETIELDVVSPTSITDAVTTIAKLTSGTLDILINNSGAGYNSPVLDIDISDARKLFELNVWSVVAVTQAFFPLLRKSKGVLVNHTSAAAVSSSAWVGAYCASKASASMFTQCLRLELAVFDIQVVELRSGIVRSRLRQNTQEPDHCSLPPDSAYAPAKSLIEARLRGNYEEKAEDAEVWARHVVGQVLMKNPPQFIWRGAMGRTAKMAWAFFPMWLYDSIMWSMGGIGEVKKAVQKR